MTVDKYNYMDKGELRNKIREQEAELDSWRPTVDALKARAEKAEKERDAEWRLRTKMEERAVDAEARVEELTAHLKRHGDTCPIDDSARKSKTRRKWVDRHDGTGEHLEDVEGGPPSCDVPRCNIRGYHVHLFSRESKEDVP